MTYEQLRKHLENSIEWECCYHSHWINEIYDQENITTIRFPENIRLANYGALYSVAEQKNSTTTLIPRISNQIWFTSPQRPKDINEDNLKTTLEAKKALDSTGYAWEHIIWTNKCGLELNSIKFLQNNGFKVMLVDDLRIQAFDLNNLIETTRFGMASDGLRYFVVNYNGGIYRDLDYSIYKPDVIERLVMNFNFFGGMDGDIYLGNAFFGASKNHPVTNETINLIDRNFSDNDEIRPQYIQRPCDLFSDTITKTGPTVFTIANHHKLNSNTNIDIVLSPGVIFNICEAKKWPGCSMTESIDLQELGLIGNDEYKATWAGPKARYPYPYSCHIREVLTPPNLDIEPPKTLALPAPSDFGHDYGY